MKQSARALVVLIALAVLIAGCTGPRYTTDYAPNADFTKYKTFAWSPLGNNLPDNSMYNNSLVDQRLVDAIEYALKGKGLTMANPAQADLHVVYHVAVERMTSYTTVNSYYGYSPYWGGYGAWGGWGMGTGTTYQNNYDEGTLVVDLLENVPGDQERIVWRGSVTDTIKQGERDPMRAREDYRRGAEDLFLEFPPGQ
ncbi:MAG: DUF4136 domain-containing protein [Acidobacteria bacterium]|nr:DUF4136 domain-containing protein [Acidobacteriota bacterium]